MGYIVFVLGDHYVLNNRVRVQNLLYRVPMRRDLIRRAYVKSGMLEFS